MPNVYYRLVKSKAWTIDQVPEDWRAEVQALLDSEGQDPADDLKI